MGDLILYARVYQWIQRGNIFSKFGKTVSFLSLFLVNQIL